MIQTLQQWVSVFAEGTWKCGVDCEVPWMSGSLRQKGPREEQLTFMNGPVKTGTAGAVLTLVR